MKTRVVEFRQEQASALLTAMVIIAIIGLSLGSYLWLVRTQALSIQSSQHWNAALAHAEAGVEEAMAHLNHKFGTNVPLGANGWSFDGAAYIHPGAAYNGMTGVRLLEGGGYKAKVVPASGPGTFPVIYATGYATVPISGNVLKRTVQIFTDISSPFPVGMAAKLDIKFKGNNITIDSFDSADPNKSTNGKYDPAKAQANGHIASTDGLVEVGNANVHGKIKTGPAGSYSFGPNGFAGPIGWNGPGLYSPEWYENDFNYEFKDVTDPFSSGVPPEIGSGTNDFVLNGGDYMVSGDWKLNGKTVLVTMPKTRLWVTGSFEMNGPSELKIQPGATLDVYVGQAAGGPTKAIFAQVNTDGNSGSFAYWGLPNNDYLKWSGNSMYVGTVYAPNATFELGGGGSDTYDYQGGCVVYEVVLNGHFNFHYDENLKKKVTPAGYMVGGWKEL